MQSGFRLTRRTAYRTTSPERVRAFAGAPWNQATFYNEASKYLAGCSARRITKCVADAAMRTEPWPA